VGVGAARTCTLILTISPLQAMADSSMRRKVDNGISVSYLATTFADEVEAAGFSKDTPIYELEPIVIRSKGQHVVCPRDGRPGAAYVDAIQEPDAVGPATHMLSYSWGYKMLRDVIPSLLQYCADADLDPKRTYVWICCLCVNQHRVQELRQQDKNVPFSEFQSTFADRVKNIGHILSPDVTMGEPQVLDSSVVYL